MDSKLERLSGWVGEGGEVGSPSNSCKPGGW